MEETNVHLPKEIWDAIYAWKIKANQLASLSHHVTGVAKFRMEQEVASDAINIILRIVSTQTQGDEVEMLDAEIARTDGE